MSTIKDVARRTGLSLSTISKYLNGGNVREENRLAIDAAVAELGFSVNVFARSLKANRSMTVGVLLPTISSPFFGRVVASLELILRRSGYECFVCSYDFDREQELGKLAFLARYHVDGIVYVPENVTAGEVRARVGAIPVVLIDRSLDQADYDTVVVDNLNAAYGAIEHLINQGHRRIGIIAGPSGIYTAQERLRGYRRVHEDFDLPIDDDLILEGDYSVESGHRLMDALLKRTDPPSAVFVTNYEMTLGAIMALNESPIRVPDELSIIGFDNQQLARIVKPALTIVVQPIQSIGETAAALLLKRLKEDHTGFPAMHRLKTRLVMDESVKRFG